jgi:hypothetical protein
VHVEGYWTNNSIRVIDQVNQFTQAGFSSQVQNIPQRRMIVARLPNLHKCYAVVQAIHDILPTATVPPLDCVIVFASGSDDPVRPYFTKLFAHERGGAFFRLAEVNIALESSGPDAEVELVVKILDARVQEVVGRLVAAVNEGVMTLHAPHLGIVFIERREMWIMLPQGWAGSADIGEKLSRVCSVQIADSGRQRYEIAR